MNRTPWIERKFADIEDVGLFPCILERLEGTPARMRQKLFNIDQEFTGKTHTDTWSIKQEIGHLTDIEPLWATRIDEILAGVTIMKAADMTNEKTHAARHDDYDIHVLMFNFKLAREATMAKLRALSTNDLLKYSLHPRLGKPMRIPDLANFVAEHDDHHLAQITFLINNAGIDV